MPGKRLYERGPFYPKQSLSDAARHQGEADKRDLKDEGNFWPSQQREDRIMRTRVRGGEKEVKKHTAY